MMGVVAVGWGRLVIVVIAADIDVTPMGWDGTSDGMRMINININIRFRPTFAKELMPS